MATTETINNIISTIDMVIDQPIEELVTNKNWGSINFQTARPDLELIFNLCQHLKTLPISLVPEPVAATFLQSLKQANKTIESIEKFSIEVANAIQSRDQIIATVKGVSENLLTQTQGWIAFLAYQRGDVQKNIAELTMAVEEASNILSQGGFKSEVQHPWVQ